MCDLLHLLGPKYYCYYPKLIVVIAEMLLVRSNMIKYPKFYKKMLILTNSDHRNCI